MIKLFVKDAVYRHMCASTLDIFVLNVQYQDDVKIKLKVTYVDRLTGKPGYTENVVVQKNDLDSWSIVL